MVNDRRGSNHSNSKLTEADVVEIRQDYVPRKVSIYSLARRFRVSPKTIHDVVRGRAWTHVGCKGVKRGFKKRPEIKDLVEKLEKDNATLCWLAGLLEGEGCFTYQFSPGITIGMTDRDVVGRIAHIFGRGIKGPYKYSHNRRPVFYTQIWGEAAIKIMELVLPLMGKRRSKTIRSHLRKWSKAPGKGHRLGTGATARCHADREHYALRMCRSCYKRDKRKKGESR